MFVVVVIRCGVIGDVARGARTITTRCADGTIDNVEQILDEIIELIDVRFQFR